MITRSYITKDGNLVICNFSNARIYDYQDVEAEERAMMEPKVKWVCVNVETRETVHIKEDQAEAKILDGMEPIQRATLMYQKGGDSDNAE